MLYWLMRKGDALLALDLGESGAINKVSGEIRHEELLPLRDGRNSREINAPEERSRRGKAEKSSNRTGSLR